MDTLTDLSTISAIDFIIYNLSNDYLFDWIFDFIPEMFGEVPEMSEMVGEMTNLT